MSTLLTEHDVCKRWGCSPRTLERYRAEGLIGIRVGSDMKYRADDVEAFEEKRATRKKKRRKPVAPQHAEEPEMDMLSA